MAAQFPRRNYPELLPLIASRWPVEGFRSSISYRVNLISGKLETAHKGEKGEVFRRDRGRRGGYCMQIQRYRNSIRET